MNDAFMTAANRQSEFAAARGRALVNDREPSRGASPIDDAFLAVVKRHSESMAAQGRELVNDRFERELNTWVSKLPSGPDSGGYLDDLERAIGLLTKKLSDMQVRCPSVSRIEGGAA